MSSPTTTDGEPVGIGDGSLYRYGWLSFWQDRYFVSLMAEAESERAEQAVLDLAHGVAALLPATGSSPASHRLGSTRGRSRAKERPLLAAPTDSGQSHLFG